MLHTLWLRRRTAAASRCGMALLLAGWFPTGPVRAQESPPLAAPPLAPASAPLVFRGVTVIDVRAGRRLPNRTVVIVGNRILAITSGPARPPQGAQVVDAHGKYLIPGLWDLHVHPMEYADIAYPVFIAQGVTGIRDAGSPTPLATLGQWKREIAAGTRVGPRLLVSGPSINQAPDSQVSVTYNGKFRHNILVPLAAARRVVDSLHSAGADFLKLYHLSAEMYFDMAEAARRMGIPFGGHIREEGKEQVIDGRQASDSGAFLLDHHPYFPGDPCGIWEPKAANQAQCTAGARHLRRNQTWVTISGWASIRLKEPQRYRARQQRIGRFLPRSIRPASRGAGEGDTSVTGREPTSTADWEMDPNAQRKYARMRAANLPVLLGTDVMISPNMPSLIKGLGGMPEGLVALVLGGWTPSEALRIATLESVQALQAADSLGTVEKGKVADLVLLDADPLADIWNTTQVRAVVANGRYYDRAALDQLWVQTEQVAARR